MWLQIDQTCKVAFITVNNIRETMGDTVKQQLRDYLEKVRGEGGQAQYWEGGGCPGGEGGQAQYWEGGGCRGGSSPFHSRVCGESQVGNTRCLE